MVKRYVHRRVVSGERRVVRGPPEAIATVLAATGSGTDINTADIERLNATCRASLVPLVRRGRAIAHTETPVTVGMWGWSAAPTTSAGGMRVCAWQRLQKPPGRGRSARRRGPPG
jgi:hypothetical protein